MIVRVRRDEHFWAVEPRVCARSGFQSRFQFWGEAIRFADQIVREVYGSANG